MPELPEVSTIVSDLNKFVRGKKISAIKGDTPKLIQPYSFSEFEKKVKGKYFTNFERKGKYILGFIESFGSPYSLHPASQGEARPDGRPTRPRQQVGPARRRGYTLVWHMRMTGHLLYRNGKKETKEAKKMFADPRNQYIRFTILFEDGSRLDFSDLRKFGTLHLFENGEANKCKGITTLGPDALDYAWNVLELKERIQKKKVFLKQALLDQTVLAGIGNIYADEILWTAKLHPLMKTASFSLEDAKRLLASLRKVLRAAVKHRGSSVDDYRDASGKAGDYARFHRAYGRKNLPCFRCGEKIVRIKINGRGTCYCPVCQPFRADPEPRRGAIPRKNKKQTLRHGSG